MEACGCRRPLERRINRLVCWVDSAPRCGRPQKQSEKLVRRQSPPSPDPRAHGRPREAALTEPPLFNVGGSNLPGTPHDLPAAEITPSASPASSADAGWATVADPSPRRCRSTARAGRVSSCPRMTVARTPETPCCPCAHSSDAAAAVCFRRQLRSSTSPCTSALSSSRSTRW